HDADALVGADGYDAARHVLQDALVELARPLEVMVQGDAVDRAGKVRSEIEQRLDVVGDVAMVHDGWSDDEHRDELPAREQGHGHDALKECELARDLRLANVARASG